MPSAHERPQLGLETLHVLDRHVVDVPSHACVDDDDLLFDRQRDVQALLQQLRQAIAAVELGLGRLVELGAEGGERLELPELRQVDLERARRPTSSP